MSESDAPRSPAPRPEKSPVTPAPPTTPDEEEEWSVDSEGVVSEPHDRSEPRPDDVLDPTDAP